MRRNTELGLLVMVVIIVGAAYVLASLGQDAAIPPNVGPFLLAVLCVLLIINVATRRLAPLADATLLPVAGLLNGIGFVFIARIREKLAWQQAAWTIVGVGAFVATLLVVRRARDLGRYRWTFALIGVVLLLLPLLPGVGTDFGSGSRIWVKLPGNFSFQPGEGAKIALAIFFASYLVEKRELLSIGGRRIGPFAIPELRHLGPVMIAWSAAVVVLVAEKDLGSSLLFFAMFIVMLWVATERMSFLMIGVTLFGSAAYLAYRLFDVVQTRVTIWFDPFSDPDNKGFQPLQALFEMSAGGVPGSGLGLGGSLRNFPEAESDFIFAVIAGELGLVGATLVLIAFLLIIGTGLRIAVNAEHEFDKLLATGLTTLIGIQAFVIIAGVTRLLPLTGVTLPFVSYGGTSLIANYVLLALLVRISDDSAAGAASSKRAPSMVGAS